MMKFKIPFTTGRIESLKKKSSYFSSRIPHKHDSSMQKYLEGADANVTREEYLGICRRTFVMNVIKFSILFSLLMFLFKTDMFYVLGPLIAIAISGFIFFSQRSYPKMFITKKQKEIERNLLPALEDIHIQLNSGIPLFNIMINLSTADYGALSSEFAKAVKLINSGVPEAEVLDRLGERNPSVFFRRTLWQMSNGMNAGSDMSVVIRDSIKALNQEQMIQIQNYGGILNPLIVMYMLISVIIPSLSVTFLTILASMLSLGKTISMFLFFGVLIFNVFFQIMFLGIIKSKRPGMI